MYNKRLKSKHLKKRASEGVEDPLVCDDVPSDDEWFVDDAQEDTAPTTLGEDLDVDLFDGNRRKVDKPSTSRDRSQREAIKKGKRKMTEIEEGEEDLEEEDWENVVTSEDEAAERAIRYDDDSNEDPTSDESADDIN